MIVFCKTWLSAMMVVCSVVVCSALCIDKYFFKLGTINVYLKNETKIIFPAKWKVVFVNMAC